MRKPYPTDLSDAEWSFSANEVALLRRVVPHLGTGLRAAVLLSQASLVQEGDGALGVLVLDRRGWLLHYTAAAERWLHELEEDPDSGWWEGRGPSAWREGKGLPTAIWTMMGTLRQALKPQTDWDLNEVPCLCVRTHSGCWLTLRGASTRQISQTLYISEYTVQDHLSNIFDKIGVRDRRALVKRLYLDAILPMVL